MTRERCVGYCEKCGDGVKPHFIFSDKKTGLSRNHDTYSQLSPNHDGGGMASTFLCPDCPNVYDCILRCQREDASDAEAVTSPEGSARGGWNFRVLRDASGRVEIHEIYYDEVGDPASWVERTARAEADSLDDLRWKLRAFLRALDEEALEVDDGRLREVD